MKIKTKLLLALCTLPLLLIILIGIGWLQISHLAKSSNTVQDNFDLSIVAEQIYRDVKDEGIILRNMVIYTNEDTLRIEEEKLDSKTIAINQNISVLESKAMTSEQKELVASLKNTNERFNSYKDKVVALATEGKREEAQLLMSENSIDIHEEFSTVIKDLTDSFETTLESSLGTMLSNFQREIIGSLLILAVSIILIGTVLYRTVWKVTERLNSMAGIMSNVANGTLDLGTKIEVDSKDEIADVANSFNHMADSLAVQIEKDQQLTWAKTHVAEITTSLSGLLDLKSLAQTFLSKIVPLVESSHAVIYVRHEENTEDEPTYKLLATYAYKERKQIVNELRAGEGLIGQAILEKSPILLTDVPADYVQITSGLGKASPLNLFVVPILFEGKVVAVIELASFKEYSEFQQNFIEELTSNLGIILENLMGRTRLAALLEESQTMMEEIQAQSEELQSQQEELRATNEELEQQTVSLRHSEEKLQVQQEELEQTNVELEEKAKSLEEQNKRFEQTNREVERARSELEEKANQLSLASKYKSEFLANMSHELRTPLNSLLILSKLLADNKEGNLTEKQMEYSRTIYSSGNDLLGLINDILDLAKIESGKMEIQMGEVFVQDLVAFVENTFSPVANEKGIAFEIILEKSLPESFYSDEIRVQQVLQNLLSNAFKFTSQGKVTLTIGTNATPTSKAGISFSVQDTGIGIPKDKLHHIFEAFQQADGTTSRKFGGTGLGLSISRENAKILNGEIIVASEEGKGSTFTFIINELQEMPIEPVFVYEAAATISDETKEWNEPILSYNPSKVEKSIEVEENNHIKRILIVDDDVRQRTSLMELIGDLDVIIKAVATGHEALEEMKVSQFDCVILDLGLNDMSGFHLLEEMKNIASTNIGRVIVYTGRVISQHEEAQLSKLSHTIIIKDEHSPQRLKDELHLFFEGGIDPINSLELEHIEDLEDLKDKQVLLVDDDVRNVYALSNILELYGMDVTFAENGVEGLEQLNGDVEFDLVLMDIMMPEMDGYEAIQRIRENPEFMDLPIIALTAKAMKEDREKCLEVGASDYIVKPVDPDQLISLIKVWLYQERN